MSSETTPCTVVLSLDGGGIRGLMTAVWLAKLEELLKDSVRDYCHILAGTSTGAILACAVASGIPAKDIVKLYQSEGRRIFPASLSRGWSRLTRVFDQGFSAPKYSADGLQEVLQHTFQQKRMSDVPAHLCLLVTTYNTLTRQATVLKSTSSPGRDMLMWEAAKSSASAPTYFPAHVATLNGANAPLIDGGVVANNPTLCGIAEAVKGGVERKPIPLEQIVVGSFGTGESTRSISIREAMTWGALEWAIPIIDVLFDGAADATNHVASHLIGDERYVRLQCRLEKAYDDMDNADKTNLNALVNLANEYLAQEGLKKLEKLTNLLRKCRKTRERKQT